MRVAGNYEFNVEKDLLWRALLNPDVLSKVVPGFERLEEVGENEYEGALTIRVGPVQGKFDGKVGLFELDPPNSYRMKLNGKGGPGFVAGKGVMSLSEGDGATALEYDFDLQVGGRLAGLGQRLLDSASKAFTKEALANLERQVLALRDAESSSEPVQEPSAPSQVAFASGVAKSMAADLVPKRTRVALLAAAAALVALLFWISLT